MLFAACGSDPAGVVEDWEGAGIEPVCDPGAVRVTGELDGATIDFTAAENYGYVTYPALWAVLLGDGVRMTLVPNDLGRTAVGWSQGVFVLGADEPLHCGTRGTKISEDPSRGELRTLTRLASCPGTEAIEGSIEGCTNPNAGCSVSGGPLPTGEIEVTGSWFSRDGPAVAFQLRLRGGEVLDVDSERAGGTVFYDGEVVCTEDVAVESPDPETFAFTVSGLTRLGHCDEAAPVSGYVNLCLPL
jgi:hypothetical protein